MNEGYFEDCYLDREGLSASCSKVQTVFEALLIPYLGSEIGMVPNILLWGCLEIWRPETKVEYNKYLYLIFFFFPFLPHCLVHCKYVSKYR